MIIKLSPLWLESPFEFIAVSFSHSLYTLIISLLSGLRCSKNIFYIFSPGYGISNSSRGMFPVIAKWYLESSMCMLGKKGLLKQEIKNDSLRKMLIHLILSDFITLKVFLLFWNKIGKLIPNLTILCASEDAKNKGKNQVSDGEESLTKESYSGQRTPTNKKGKGRYSKRKKVKWH